MVREQLLKTTEELTNGFDVPSVLEKMVDIKKEIAQMIAVDANGNTALYPPVEMIFDPVLNLLDYQLCPAALETKVLWKVEAIALAVARNFNSPGLFAVELFIDKNDDVWVNETAPEYTTVVIIPLKRIIALSLICFGALCWAIRLVIQKPFFLQLW
jgi:5-(carboxyamino)imidazole ribonucleotide synthase